MGINSKAIERIDKQIRMLKEDYTFNNIDDSYEYEDDYDDTDTELDDTVKLNHISEIDDDYEKEYEEDTTKENIITDYSNEKNEIVNEVLNKDTNESEDGVNIFLIYYIGIIIIAIVAIVLMYFLFT